jgi:pyruvate formate lyase activating enzyme
MNAFTSPNLQGSSLRHPSVAPQRPLDRLVGGVTPFTSVDFPGRLAAVLFTQGCAWRCRYCHNSHLWPFDPDGTVPFDKIIGFLETRRGLLDGVVFCGGEPTAHPALPEAMRTVKRMGFEVALHTSGMYPDRLQEALSLCDWVGLDIKAPFEDYERVTRVSGSGVGPRESLGLLLRSGVDHEVRTTVHPELLNDERILAAAGELRAMGVRRYALQIFRPQGCADARLTAVGPLDGVVSEMLRGELSGLFEHFEIRNQS